MRQFRNSPAAGLLYVACLLTAYLCVASVVWQVRNPKANPMTFWTHFPDAVYMKKLDKFQ